MNNFKNYTLLLIFVVFSCKKENRHSLKSNDLINETSPYLLQHAYNPVKWKAWNTKTLELAKKENKLIIISIGYSACHWCHVMEEESFENDSIAKIMNKNFINIKVDREERPDIDNIYMNAVQLITGSGGWPLNCITLPDGRPIFGGTYFTKDQWSEILINISKLYKEEPEKTLEYAENLTKGLQESQLIAINKEKPSFKAKEVITAVNSIKEQLDTVYGGFKGAPKFPTPTTLEFLWRYNHQYKDQFIENYLHRTLTKLTYGGIYDQVSGGFSRYSVDDKWHIPHFEKMLYDNAQLVSIYSKAYMINKKELYKTTVVETINFIKKELTNKDGAFYSSIDADSYNVKGEKEEGAYYVWKIEELKRILNKDFELFKTFYNINDYGFWEKDNYVLIRDKSIVEFANKNKISKELLLEKISNWKILLQNERDKKSKPSLDDKVLTSWNALMIQAYIDAYKAFNNNEYLKLALKNANFLINNQLREDFGLNRNYKEGKSTINAYLEDYGTVIQSFISLYEVTLNEKWLNKSKELMNYLFINFFDEKTNMFYFTSKEDKSLIAKKTEIIDGVIPSSNALICSSLFKLGHYFSDNKYLKTSELMLNNIKPNIFKYPANYCTWLNVMMNYTNPFYEVVIAGKKAKEFNKTLNNYFLPNIVIAGSTSENSILPLLSYKYNENETLIYVCVNGTCKLPQKNIHKAVEKIKNK